MKFRLSISIFIIHSLLLSSCKENNTIQGVYVDTYIYLSEPSSVQLNAVGGWIYYPGGAKGLIVYRKSTTEFAAYDRQCTYDPTASCALLQVQSSGVTVVDSCCGSEFSLIYGGVTKGPASQPMIQYRTTYEANSVHVFN